MYATFTGAPEHPRARAWLDGELSGAGAAVCWPVLYALWRLMTSPRIAGSSAISVPAGRHVVAAFVAHPGARLVAPGSGHAAIAEELAATPGLRSDDVPDIEIASLAIEHGLVLATHDSGFRRFPKLRVTDPLS